MSGTAGALWRSKLRAAAAAPAPLPPAPPPPLADITAAHNRHPVSGSPTACGGLAGARVRQDPAAVAAVDPERWSHDGEAGFGGDASVSTDCFEVDIVPDSEEEEDAPSFDILGEAQPCYQAARGTGELQQQKQQEEQQGMSTAEFYAVDEEEHEQGNTALHTAPGGPQHPHQQHEQQLAEEDWASPVVQELQQTAGQPSGAGGEQGTGAARPTTRSRSTSGRRRQRAKLKRLFDEEPAELDGQGAEQPEEQRARPAWGEVEGESSSDLELQWPKQRPAARAPLPAPAAAPAAAPLDVAANAAFAVRGLKRLQRVGDSAANPVQPAVVDQQQQQQQELMPSPAKPAPAQRRTLSLTPSRPAAGEAAQGPTPLPVVAGAAPDADPKPKGNPFARTAAAVSRVVLARTEPTAEAPGGIGVTAELVASAIGSTAQASAGGPNGLLPQHAHQQRPWQTQVPRSQQLQTAGRPPAPLGARQRQQAGAPAAGWQEDSDSDFDWGRSRPAVRPGLADGQPPPQQPSGRLSLRQPEQHAQQQRQPQQAAQHQGHGPELRAPQEEPADAPQAGGSSGGVQPFWQPPYDCSGAGDGGWGPAPLHGWQEPHWQAAGQQRVQQQQGHPWPQPQQTRTFWQAEAEQEEEGPADPGQGAGPLGRAWGEVPGGSGSAWDSAGDAWGDASGGSGQGQQPWWHRFPDFVPVDALRGGRNPRDGSQVFVDFKRQFSGQAGGGTTSAAAAAARTDARGGGGGAPRRPRAPAGGGGGSAAATTPGGSRRGHWEGGEGGAKVYINKDGRKLFGQIAYLEYLKETGRRNPSGSKKKKQSGGAAGGGRKRKRSRKARK